MGVDIERERRGVGRAERKPEFDGTPPVRDEVGAGDLQAVDRRQRHLRVAEARGEARRRADPLAVDAEPDAVEQLDRRGPDAAHLAARVKTHGRVAAVFAAEIVGAVAGGGVAPIGEIARDRECGAQARIRQRLSLCLTNAGSKAKLNAESAH